jgi:hypothetical protein
MPQTSQLCLCNCPAFRALCTARWALYFFGFARRQSACLVSLSIIILGSCHVFPSLATAQYNSKPLEDSLVNCANAEFRQLVAILFLVGQAFHLVRLINGTGLLEQAADRYSATRPSNTSRIASEIAVPGAVAHFLVQPDCEMTGALSRGHGRTLSVMPHAAERHYSAASRAGIKRRSTCCR